jgi:hypothetical protein
VVVAALLSIVISIGALAISWLAYRAAHTEEIVLTSQRYMGDYASKMKPQPGILGPAIFDTYWECLLSNTGDMTISIIEGNVWRVENGGLSQYSNMRGGVLDEKGKAITFPITIEAGHSKKLLFLLRPKIIEKAYKILISEYPDHSIPSLRIAQNILAANSTDFFGNSIKPFYDGSNVTGFSVENSEKEPNFAFKFVTSRGKTVVSLAGWYPSPDLFR